MAGLGVVRRAFDEVPDLSLPRPKIQRYIGWLEMSVVTAENSVIRHPLASH